jgi:hypothetical protein
MKKIILLFLFCPLQLKAQAPAIEKIDLSERIQYVVQENGTYLFQYCSPKSCKNLVERALKLDELVAQLEDDPPKSPFALQILTDASVSQKPETKSKSGAVGFLVGKENQKAVSCPSHQSDKMSKILKEKKVGAYLQWPIKGLGCTYLKGPFDSVAEQSQDLALKLKAALD